MIILSINTHVLLGFKVVSINCFSKQCPWYLFWEDLGNIETTKCTSTFTLPKENGVRRTKPLQFEISYSPLDKQFSRTETSTGTEFLNKKHFSKVSFLRYLGTYATCGFQVELVRKRGHLILHVRMSIPDPALLCNCSILRFMFPVSCLSPSLGSAS